MTAGGIPRGPLAAVMAAAVIVSLNVGKLPPALPMLREEFGLDLVAASLLVSFFQLAGMHEGRDVVVGVVAAAGLDQPPAHALGSGQLRQLFFAAEELGLGWCVDARHVNRP